MTANADSTHSEFLRALPQVEAVLLAGEASGGFSPYRRDAAKRLIQAELAAWREAIKLGRAGQPPSAEALAARVTRKLEQLTTQQLKPAVNATGILLHTNLGRAVLSERAQAALLAVTKSYCNLEMDLATGQRSRRDVHLEPLLQALTGCEAATVVNNNAAAVFLALQTLAAGRDVITSRGELIEIGGSFRIPDIMRSARCKLVEVGTTNRTRISDYQQAISMKTALLLKTHPSNYRVRGFTEETSLEALVELGQSQDLPVYYDIGSGYIETPKLSGLSEPEVVSALAAGADLVSFSGDKLLGGPQAGILAGKRKMIQAIQRNPLWRIVRIDKFTAAALEATLAELLLAHSVAKPPALIEVAEQLAQAIRNVQPKWEVAVADGEGYYGGGSLPDEAVLSVIVQLKHPSLTPEELDRQARCGHPPVVGYVRQGAFVINVFTLLVGDVERIAQCLAGLARE
jgi:L-seryl-tRNA(Ser) seleniumtransferase